MAPVVRAAARGELPAWAEVSAERFAHIRRVADLLGSWADSLRLSPAERERWVAAGWLHDALRDAPPEALRAQLPAEFRSLDGPLLHGPAVAERLGKVVDARLVNAIRYHTVGHPSLDRLGRALYLADFLEPGRDFDNDWRAALRERMPTNLTAVLIEVVAARLRNLVERRMPIRPESAEFWNAVVRESR
ncbi:MAG TPA: HD domain-containing protein [Longimicrobiaceae bacterium]|nr:HD domain-containing protein [Longimicrobiaceae bacterium]